MDWVEVEVEVEDRWGKGVVGSSEDIFEDVGECASKDLSISTGLEVDLWQFIRTRP